MGDSFTDSGIGDFFQNITGLIRGVTPTITNAINPEDAWRYGYTDPSGRYSAPPQQSSNNLLIIGAIVVAIFVLAK